MKAELVYWAFCCWREYEGRRARGFVLASNQHDALKKARKRVVHERRRFAKSVGLLDIGVMSNRGRYAVRVWRDPSKATAPHDCKHYIERERSTA